MALFTTLLPITPLPVSLKPKPYPVSTRVPSLTIECSSRPQKKATAHHAKSRPKKTALWDKKRRPTVYPPLPPLPPDWTLLSSGDDAAPATAATAAAVVED